MPVQKLRPSFSFDPQRLEALKSIAPEIFADGAINWDVLKDVLGEYLEEEDAKAEHFGLNWPGKRTARRRATEPCNGALSPIPGSGVNEDTTHNVFIEADNLDALKLLQKAYAGRVKMIYIDPPYNTGNDFVYRDDFRESQEDYLKNTGELNEHGQALTTNPKSSGRFHSTWLNMMYPRLRLARTLLRDDGVIFVSIDDNEAHHLRIMMDEIFGAENFIANISWEKRYTRSNNARLFYSLKDTILLYRKSPFIDDIREPRTDKSDSIYKNPDKDPRGVWTSSSYVNPATKAQRPNLVYPIKNPFTGQIIEHPTHAWKYEFTEHQRHIDEKRLWWGKNEDAKFPRLKNFLSESDGGLVPVDLWDYHTSGTTDDGGAELKELFTEVVFDNPKPTKLIKRMLKISTSSDDCHIVLDFFGGSGSTAQAVLELNQEDGGNRQFILVQLPEPTPSNSTAQKAGYQTISQITQERIRRVLAKLEAEHKSKLPLDKTFDLGFRAYRFTPSNFAPWQDYEGNDIEQLELLFDQSPLIEGWNEADLLTELMLLQGFPLDSRIEKMPEFKANKIQKIASDFHEHHLFVCLDEKIAQTTIECLELSTQDIFVCLDSALTDEAKIRLTDNCNLRVI